MAKVLVRTGQCDRCGKCCHLSNLLTAPANSDIDLFVSPLMNFIRCTHFEYDEFGRATCKIFNDPNRPPCCALHPSSPASLIKGCGYKFHYE